MGIASTIGAVTEAHGYSQGEAGSYFPAPGEHSHSGPTSSGEGTHR